MKLWGERIDERFVVYGKMRSKKVAIRFSFGFFDLSIFATVLIGKCFLLANLYIYLR